jgi:gas vesicle protein
MKKENRTETPSNMLSGLAGFMIGGLAGALTMLLLAPQSGKDTRMQIKQKGIELRDETTEMVDKAVAQMQTNTNKIVTGGREKINEIKEQSRGFATEQLDRVTDAVRAGKKAIENA